jgi:hypothetical protein
MYLSGWEAILRRTKLFVHRWQICYVPSRPRACRTVFIHCEKSFHDRAYSVLCCLLSATVPRCVESPRVVGTAVSSPRDGSSLLQRQHSASSMASSRNSSASDDVVVRFDIRPTAASAVPARAAVIGTPSARIQQTAGRTYMEPPFIETDFTVPIDASTSGRLLYRHDIKLAPLSSSSSSSRPSPAAAMSPSSAAVSPALPLRSPDATAVDRSRPILSPATAAVASSPSPNRAKILPVPMVLARRNAADGAQNLVIKDEFTLARGSTLSHPKYAAVAAASHIQQSASTGTGTTPEVSNRARMIVKPVHHPVSVKQQLNSADSAFRQHVIVSPRSGEAKLLVEAHRSSSVNRVDRPSGAPVTMATGSLASSNRVLAHGHGQQAAHGRGGVIGSTYNRHQHAEVARQQSFSELIPKPVRRFEVVGGSPTDDHLRHVRDSASAPLSILSSSSLSGGFVYQQQQQQQKHLSQSSHPTPITGSVLRPALMRMAAINPEASRAFRSTVSLSPGSVAGPAAAHTTTSPTASGRLVAQRTTASATSDLTSHYRAIQPKPVGMAVRGPHFSSLQSIRVDPRAISAGQINIRSPPSSTTSHAPDRMSTVIITRPPHSTSSSFVPMTVGSRRPVASSALSVQSAVLNVPRVPVAAHISPKTAPLPPSSLPPPPYMHRSPLVSPPPPPSHLSTSDLMPVSATVSRNSFTAAKSTSSLSAASCNRSAHQVVSTVPRYSMDSFDQMPLDCSRKNSAAVDAGCVLNLTTSGNQSKAYVHQSEVIDLSGGSSSGSGGSVNAVAESAVTSRQVRGREALESLSTGNGELEDLTVRKKVVVKEEQNDVSEQENERLASIVGLKKVTDLSDSGKLAATQFGNATSAVAFKSATVCRQIENGFVAGRSPAAREVIGNGSGANAEHKGGVLEDRNSHNGRSFNGVVARVDTAADCINTSIGLCCFT